MSGEGAEREGDTESEAGSRLSAVSTEPDAGLKLTDCEIITWAEVGRPTDWATQAPLFLSIYKIFLKMFIYFWERQSMSRRGSEREGDTESEAGSRLWAVSTERDTGFQLRSCEIMTWAEVGRLTNWATQGSLKHEFLVLVRSTLFLMLFVLLVSYLRIFYQTFDHKDLSLYLFLSVW